MFKLARTLMLMAAMGGLATSTVTLATAQEKKKTDDKKAAPADDKKKTTATEAASGEIEIYQSKKGGFRFRITGADGKALCGAYKDYATKEECLEVVNTIKNTLTKKKPVEVKE